MGDNQGWMCTQTQTFYGFYHYFKELHTFIHNFTLDLTNHYICFVLRNFYSGFMVLRKFYGIMNEFIVFKELLYSLKELL